MQDSSVSTTNLHCLIASCCWLHSLCDTDERITMLQVLNASNFVQEVDYASFSMVLIIVDCEGIYDVINLALWIVGIFSFNRFEQLSCMRSTLSSRLNQVGGRRLLFHPSNCPIYSCAVNIAYLNVNLLLSFGYLYYLLWFFILEEVALLQYRYSCALANCCARPILPDEATLIRIVDHSILSCGQ